ncbi:MAG: tRNA (N6-isopentenyl adenosine(37)-C2)-methylthiotransferase MiaB [Leptospirales bacterium]
MAKTYYIETYGCQMNQYDSLITGEILENKKLERVLVPDEADLILINTCSVRENAHQKVYNRLQNLGHLQRKGAKIGILGCMAQALGESLFEKGLPVNIIAGPDSLKKILDSQDDQVAYLDKTRDETYEDIIPSIDRHLGINKDSLNAYVAIQRGCNNFCTFCVVPFTRGRERTRSPDSIVQEIKALVDCGMKTITLLGQNVNSYQHDEISFTDLVKKILDETDVKRLYYSSPHPKDFPEELITLTSQNSRMGTMVHIPLQSGSDRILELMKREYTSKEFLRLVDLFRNTIPELSLTTDVIVGFPGETQSEFEDTLDIMEKSDFDAAFMFSYSERPWTYASKHYQDDISSDEKSERLARLIELQLKRSLKKNRVFENSRVKIMIEGISRRSDSEIIGTTLSGKKVIAPIPEGTALLSLLGQEHDVLIQKATSSTLWGNIVNPQNDNTTEKATI